MKELILNEDKLQRAIGFSPHDNQRVILQGLKRFTVITAGRRFGKTIIASYLALKQLMLPQKTIWIVAPTYDLAKRTWRYIYGWVLREMPWMKINLANLSIENPSTGSFLELKTAENPASCVGAGVDLLIVDEASRIKDSVWEEALYPTLADKLGTAVLISTPHGKNWFYHMHLKGKTHKDHISFSFETQDNMALPHLKEEQAEAKRQLPENAYQQEWLARFLDDAGQVFRGIRKCVKGELEPPRDEASYVMGVDFAKHQDWTVITVIDLTAFHVVAFERFNKIDWEFQIERIKSLSKKYRQAPIVVDATGVGDPLAENLKREGCVVTEYKYTNASKKMLIENLVLKIERGEISFPEIEVMLDELESFGYEITPSRNITYNAPDGMHDDCVNSLALAVWGMGHYKHGEIYRKPEYPPGSMGALREKIESQSQIDELKFYV